MSESTGKVKSGSSEMISSSQKILSEMRSLTSISNQIEEHNFEIGQFKV